MSLIEIKVPDIGDFDAVEIIEVLVSVGEEITENQDLITLESDKAAMEIPSSASGKIVSMNVAVGDKVSEGSVILTLETASEQTTAGTAAPSNAEPVATTSKPTVPTPATSRRA